MCGGGLVFWGACVSKTQNSIRDGPFIMYYSPGLASSSTSGQNKVSVQVVLDANFRSEVPV